MSDPLDDFEELREGLERELAEYEEMVPKAVARLDRLRSVLRVGPLVASEIISPLEFMFPNDPTAVELYRFIRDNPGAGRKVIDANLKVNKKIVKREDLNNVISKLSRAKLIVNKGGNRTSSWFIAE